jgi:hypothetical protein
VSTPALEQSAGFAIRNEYLTCWRADIELSATTIRKLKAGRTVRQPTEEPFLTKNPGY